MRKINILIIGVVLVLSSILPYMFKPTMGGSTWLQDDTQPGAYMTIEGVLDSDTYYLYPFALESLKIGFSAFGEMIDSSTNVGLEYDDTDPFAPGPGSAVSAHIPKRRWYQGWLINITYTNIGDFPKPTTRNVWAMAMFSDGLDFGGPWLRVDLPNDWEEDPTDPGYQISTTPPYDNIGDLRHGGRKTNGTALTEPIKVLYNGPRLFVAELHTEIMDRIVSAGTVLNVPLVDIRFTIIFNKVKKEVIILKDIKCKLDLKTIGSNPVKIQFSNRGQVDLGNDIAGYSQYYHFWVAYKLEGQPTVYDKDWHANPTVDLGKATLHAGEPGDTFDVFQSINPDISKVFFAAFWPSCSDWEAYGWEMRFRSIDEDDPHSTDHPPEGDHPFFIGEWDFELTAVDISPSERKIQFRGVTVYGVVDLDEAEDENWGGANILEDEAINYQLKEVFNPWDLVASVEPGPPEDVPEDYQPESKLIRYAEHFSGDSYTTEHAGWYVDDEHWDDYCVFSERIIDLDTGWVLIRGVDYTLTEDTGTHQLIVTVSYSGNFKILYSGREAAYEWGIVGREPISGEKLGSRTVDSAGLGMVVEAFDSLKGIHVYVSALDTMTPGTPEVPAVFARFGTGFLRRNDYRYGYPDDNRSALIQEWEDSYRHPVTSADLIIVGGPAANLGSEYFNEFVQAVFRYEFFNKLDWLVYPCWSPNKIRDYPTGDKGLAIIATYKDINGTVGFIVYGATGRDTWYAAYWLVNGLDMELPDGTTSTEPGIYILQGLNKGTTTIVIEFTYPDSYPYTPSGKIVENLGTISEKPQHDP